MFLQLLGLSLALFTLTGAVSSAHISQVMYDHIDEPSNTYVNYGTQADYQVPLSFVKQSSDYEEIYYSNVWSSVDYVLYARYNFKSDFSYSRMTFYRCDFMFYRAQDDYDSITWYGNFVLNADGYSFNDYDFAFSLNVDVNYNYEAFTCLFTLDASLLGTGKNLDEQETFRVDEEYAYVYYTESSEMRLNFTYFTNYNQGYDDGKTYVLTHLSDFNLYTQSQYLTYGQIRYNLGVSQGNYGFMNLFGAIADTPVIMIRNLFSFDLFGMSALTIFMSLLTGLIVIHFIRKVI